MKHLINQLLLRVEPAFDLFKDRECQQTALDVLGANGEFHGIIGAGRKTFQHVGHAVRIQQFLGPVPAIGTNGVRVFTVGGVDQCNRLV